LRDGVFVRDGQSLILTFANLDQHATYDFLIYGAAANTGDYSLFSATGQITQQAFLDKLLQNDSQVGRIERAIPDEFGRIALTFEGRRADGSLQNGSVNDDGQGRFNFVQITANFLAVPGDYNGDRFVTLADYLAWKLAFGTTNSAADGNRDGIVDAADYTIWRNALNGVGSASGHAAGGTVPEPASIVLAIVVCLCGFAIRRGH
jgi:hypothetical protein